MQIRILGPVDATIDGSERSINGLRRKAIIAVLALRRGDVVSTDHLIDVVWGENPPSTAGNTLQSHISQLRRLLGSRVVIRPRSPGYLLDLAAGGTDLDVVRHFVRQADEAADPSARAGHLRSALAVWRGPSLADVAELTWLGGQARQLERLRLDTQAALAEARLALGEHADLVAGLEGLSREHPHDERISRQLILALYRCGRQADALAAYQRLRRSLIDDLGIDPSQGLRDLEGSILRQDPALDPGVPAAPVSGASPVPAQLPPAVPGFVGRQRELAALDALLPGGSGAPSGGVVISAVSGTAGIGKTALALEWAHRIAERFGDGQLYADLRGFSPVDSQRDPAEVLRVFFDAFDVPVERIPAGLDARIGLYRSLLAGKRILVLLDNVRDAEQARPLLPGTPGCLAILTSRDHLTPLVVANSARPVPLDVLTGVEAGDLLVQRLGRDRTASEPDAVEEIVERCSGLPLALAIVAARAASNPRLSLASLVTQLRTAPRTLDGFDGGDPATDVRTVFDWSYRTLSAPAARLFRLLGLHPGPQATLPVVASIAGQSPEHTRPLLTELTRAHLLAEATPDRYAFHDLLRAYAVERLHQQESPEDQHAASRRMLDHYLHTAHACAALLDPYRYPIDPRSASQSRSPDDLLAALPGVTVYPVRTAVDALGWFRAEHYALLDAVQRADDDRYAWQIARVLTEFHLRYGHWSEQIIAQTAALEAARRLDDPVGQAHALNGLALGRLRAGSFDVASPLFLEALGLFEKLDDAFNQAHAHRGLTWCAQHEGELGAALDHSLRAVELFRSVGDRAWTPYVHNDVGFLHALMGDFEQALPYCLQAMSGIHELGDRSWESTVWDSLGYVHAGLGAHEQAVAAYQNSIDLSHDLGDRFNEADSLSGLGDAHAAAGRTEAARQAWRAALGIFVEIDHPEADEVRAKLNR